MTVRCDGANAAGIDQVLVPGPSFRECTVTAVDGSRQRRTAVISTVEPRTYRCFAAPDAPACE
jgi:hypothetical protein